MKERPDQLLKNDGDLIRYDPVPGRIPGFRPYHVEEYQIFKYPEFVRTGRGVARKAYRMMQVSQHVELT